MTGVAGAIVTRRPAGQDRSLGAIVLTEGRARFRVWAPEAREVALELAWPADAEPRSLALEPREPGYFGVDADAVPGTRYRFALDGRGAFPDPASRYQPEGPAGPSELIDPSTFAWTDAGWPGLDRRGLVVYEMHVGTFTREGTWRAAAAELDWLGELGVTVIEMLPVAAFPGRFGWGYDGVCPFAPTQLYGRPDDLRAFVDRAHALGIGVVLDVVYNHLGVADCSLGQFSRRYFADQPSDWGPAFNFDGPDAAPVREFVAANAAYWIREYHFDGLRLDATQQVFDRSPVHIITEIVSAARRAAPGRRLWIVGENEPQDTGLMRPPERGGCGLDALWNDDYHHSAMVAATGRREAYYTDHLGAPQEFVSAAKYGFLFQGQRYAWQQQPRGGPTFGLEPWRFVAFLQNHDQVANSATGARLHQLTSSGRLRALTALTLLGPWTPMLFQGQEFAASTPFLYFADHAPDLAAMVADGRASFLRQFPSMAGSEGPATEPMAPHDPRTFRRSQLTLAERERQPAAVALHRSLLEVRRTDATIRAQGAHGIDGAVLAPQAFVLRWFGDSAAEGARADRLLVVNLGAECSLDVVPEPLLAPPVPGRRWTTLWSSDDPTHGGPGRRDLDAPAGWRLPAESAYLLG